MIFDVKEGSMNRERPICGNCGERIPFGNSFTYDSDSGVFNHWMGDKCKGGAHSAGPANTPGSAGATPATPVKPKHSKMCVCLVCRPFEPAKPVEPEPEILPLEEKA